MNVINSSIDSVVGVVKGIESTTNQAIILTRQANEKIASLMQAQKIINDVNNIGTEWFNISFNMVFQHDQLARLFNSADNNAGILLPLFWHVEEERSITSHFRHWKMEWQAVSDS